MENFVSQRIVRACAECGKTVQRLNITLWNNQGIPQAWQNSKRNLKNEETNIR